jgi:hypothetical protein
MPRKRQYQNDADRQAAHRARKQDSDAQLMFTLHQLDEALWNAGDRGDGLALACRCSSIAAMLKRLIRAFDARPGDTDNKPALPDRKDNATL